MLINYSVSNFCSIYKEQSFNMIAVNSYKEMIDTNIIEYKPSLNLLKSTAIYGPNASGKSTLLESLDVLRGLVLDSFKYDINQELPVVPFAFQDEANFEPTTFDISFVEDGIKYEFEVMLTRTRILEEHLTAYPKGQPQSWYSRYYNESTDSYDYEYSSLFKGQRKTWESSTKKNVLFLSTAVNLQNSEDSQLFPVFNWFDDKLTPLGVNSWSDMMSKNLCKDEHDRKLIVDFLKLAGIDILDIDVEVETRQDMINKITNTKERESFLKMTEEVEKLVKNKDLLELIGTNIKISFIHTNGVKLSLNAQSDGTKKLFAFASLWLDSLKEGRVLFCDELNDNLHPALVKLLVDLFNDAELNTNKAQLVFTTHETSILNQEVLRRDQVWFCERDENLSTRLYPLSDFTPRKDFEDIENSYLSGRYGAIPYFKKVNYKMNLSKG